MDWLTVVSSVFTAAAYNEESRELYLKFHDGDVYRYSGFPPHQYDEFLAAESQGKYFAGHIRGRFRHEKVREVFLPAYFTQL